MIQFICRQYHTCHWERATKKPNKIHLKLNPFMCWVECVPNQLRIQWFMAKVLYMCFSAQPLSPTLNLVHRSNDTGFLSISSWAPFYFIPVRCFLAFLFSNSHCQNKANLHFWHSIPNKQVIKNYADAAVPVQFKIEWYFHAQRQNWIQFWLTL